MSEAILFSVVLTCFASCQIVLMLRIYQSRHIFPIKGELLREIVFTAGNLQFVWDHFCKFKNLPFRSAPDYNRDRAYIRARSGRFYLFNRYGKYENDNSLVVARGKTSTKTKRSVVGYNFVIYQNILHRHIWSIFSLSFVPVKYFLVKGAVLIHF